MDFPDFFFLIIERFRKRKKNKPTSIHVAHKIVQIDVALKEKLWNCHKGVKIDPRPPPSLTASRRVAVEVGVGV